MVGGIGGNGDPWTPQRVQAGDPVGTPARGWWRGGQAVLGGRADVPGSRWEAGAVSSPLPTVQQVSPVSDRFSSAEWKPRVVGKGVGSGRHKRPKWGREVAPDTGRSLVPSRANDASDDDDDDEEEEEEKEPASAAWLAALDMAAAAVAKTEPVTPKTPEVAEPTTPRQPVAEAETVSVDTALSDPVRSPVKVPPASEHLISIAEWPLRSIAAYRRWMQQQRPQWIETNTTRLPSAAALPLSTTASESLSDADVALSDTFDAEPGRRAAVYPNTPAGQQLESKHAAEMEALSQESRERLAQLMDAPERDIERITDTLRQQEHLLRHVRALHAFERRLLRDDPRFVVGAVRAGSEALVYAAVCECVLEGFPRVFDLSPEWRRSRKVRGVVHALTELVRFNPMANGMQARQDWVRRQRTAELLRGGRQPVAEASSPVIELPHTSSVTESYAEAVAACWRGLGARPQPASVHVPVVRRSAPSGAPRLCPSTAGDAPVPVAAGHLLAQFVCRRQHRQRPAQLPSGVAGVSTAARLVPVQLAAQLPGGRRDAQVRPAPAGATGVGNCGGGVHASGMAPAGVRAPAGLRVSERAGRDDRRPVSAGVRAHPAGERQEYARAYGHAAHVCPQAAARADAAGAGRAGRLRGLHCRGRGGRHGGRIRCGTGAFRGSRLVRGRYAVCSARAAAGRAGTAAGGCRARGGGGGYSGVAGDTIT
eukprot:ctg_2324.g505